jgi:protein dithiol:quinone oxidoreductase
MKPPTATQVLAALVALPLVAVAIALVSQHGFDMQPCPWCVLQRLIFIVIALVALIGLGWRSRRGARTVALTIEALAAAGVATALWQHFVAAASTSCNLTLADRIVSASGLASLLPEVFEARASCAEAAVDMLGVPYALWGLAVFVVIGAADGLLLARGFQRGRPLVP